MAALVGNDNQDGDVLGSSPSGGVSFFHFIKVQLRQEQHFTNRK